MGFTNNNGVSRRLQRVGFNVGVVLDGSPQFVHWTLPILILLIMDDSWGEPPRKIEETKALKHVEDAEDEDFPAANIDGDLSGKNQHLNQQKLGILKTILKVHQSTPFKKCRNAKNDLNDLTINIRISPKTSGNARPKISRFRGSPNRGLSPASWDDSCHVLSGLPQIYYTHHHMQTCLMYI